MPPVFGFELYPFKCSEGEFYFEANTAIMPSIIAKPLSWEYISSKYSGNKFTTIVICILTDLLELHDDSILCQSHTHMHALVLSHNIPAWIQGY